ncbi:MAG: VanZ family protein [Paludibacter sp.]|nr:VanZ family protein [Paludibacter sp.]
MQNKKLKYISIAIILLITAALYLWPDFHPEKVVVSDHKWYYDLIVHGGYFFIATLALLMTRLKFKAIFIGLSFFFLSIILELLQYFSYNRSVDIVDIGCNFVGIFLAVGVFSLVYSFYSRRANGVSNIP